MANIKITQLTEIVAPANEDVLPIVDVSGDITQKVQAANLPISTATQTALDAKQATLVSGTNIKTINSTSLLGSGDIAIAANPAGTAGQIQFSDGSAFAADSNLFWDNTNKRLGVGTSSPTKPITVYGSVGVVGANEGITFNNTSGTTEYGSLKLNTSTGESRWYTNNSYFPTIYSSGQEVVRINTSRQMGIGTTTPTARLHIKGSGSTSATTALLVQNSSGTELLKVTDDGRATFTGSGHDLNTDGFRLRSQNAAVTYINVTSSTGYFDCQQFRFFNTAVAVGGTATPGASVVLQADSTTKGFLPPRMTTTQKNAISTPAEGLMVMDITTHKLCVYDGTSWVDLH